MIRSDFFSLFQWWLTFFVIGSVFLPITMLLFKHFFDRGYIFSKFIGIACISYVVFLLGILHLTSFSRIEIIFLLLIAAIANGYLFITQKSIQQLFIKSWRICMCEEGLFMLGFFCMSLIRAYQPDIHGLEKYMDYGFVNSILRSSYFPPTDMWFSPFSINYYYFGHLITAVLTKLSTLPSSSTYNLMLGTLFASTFTASFSIGANLLSVLDEKLNFRRILLGGILSALLVTCSGNLHVLYTFFTPYENEHPVPLWELTFSLTNPCFQHKQYTDPRTKHVITCSITQSQEEYAFPNAYWYPNATRFIHNTIHEFPSYSYIVSDLHGHVLDIPFVLLFIAFSLSIVTRYAKVELSRSRLLFVATTFGFLLAIMYMTNAWDGIIYFLLASITILFLFLKKKHKLTLDVGIDCALAIAVIVVSYTLFSLPFSLFFSAGSIAHGIGILCAPNALTAIGKVGPFLFEPDHCQKSPLWQLAILYGFFYFWVTSLFIFLFKKSKHRKSFSSSDIFVCMITFLGTILIIIPEFFYLKDIYPAHYRANTMFKLVYQAFILLSLVSGYSIFRLFSFIKSEFSLTKKIVWYKGIFYVYFIMLSFFLITCVLMYPYFGVMSYYNNLKTYQGINGTTYLRTLYPTDYAAIMWLNEHITSQPVILEAQGDSYTDYARVSAYTGLPTVLGWTVHEWLWRGTYDIPAPRITDIQTLYETSDVSLTKKLVNTYHISLVFVGILEKQKYPKLDEAKFKKIGTVIYHNGATKIYQLHSEQ